MCTQFSWVGRGKSLPDLFQVCSVQTLASLSAKIYLHSPIKSIPQLVFRSGTSLISISSPLYCDYPLSVTLGKHTLCVALTILYKPHCLNLIGFHLIYPKNLKELNSNTQQCCGHGLISSSSQARSYSSVFLRVARASETPGNIH